MKTSSKSLKTINKIVNFLWLSYVFFAILVTASLYYIPLAQEFNFSLKENGKIYSSNGIPYDFEMSIAEGIVSFPNGVYPAPIMSYLYYFLFTGISIYIFYQFKKIINNVTEKITFNESNFLRLRKMGFALLSLVTIELLYFFLVQNLYADLVEHSAIVINTRFNLFKHFDLYGFFCGLGLIVLSEAFKEGFSLKQETELTI